MSTIEPNSDLYQTYFNKDNQNGWNHLTDLAVDPNTDFAEVFPATRTNFNYRFQKISGGNIFHFCAAEHAQRRLNAIVEGLHQLTAPNASVSRALNSEANSKTPLYIAVETNRPDITKIFLELGMNAENRKAAKQLAKDKKLTEVLKTFREYSHKNDLLKCLKHGDFTAAFQHHLKANPSNLPEASSSQQSSPMHLAILGGNKAKKSEKEILNLLKKLNEKGANPDLKNREGKTPLFLAVENGYLSIIDYLLEELKVDKTAKDNYGNTILHIAARGKDENVVNQILSYITNGDINAQNDAGQTPLHNVHKPRIAKILCDRGADPRKTDGNNHKPIHYFLIRKERHYLLDTVISLSELNEEEQKHLRDSENELSSHIGGFILNAAKAAFDITFLVNGIRTTLSVGGSIISTLIGMLIKKGA